MISVISRVKIFKVSRHRQHVDVGLISLPNNITLWHSHGDISNYLVTSFTIIPDPVTARSLSSCPLLHCQYTTIIFINIIILFRR